MVKEKIIPVRGTKKDWSKDEVVQNNKTYAKEVIKNQLIGYPDFEEYKDFIVKKENKKI